MVADTVSRFRLPDLGIGVGFRIPHYQHVVEQRPSMDWFEVISENFMVDGGSPLHYLERLMDGYPVVQHGVSMSIGGPEIGEHTQRLVALAKRTGTPWLSDHVCFTGSARVNAHDLLPVPYTPEMLDHMVERSKRMADALPCVFALENPSSYLSFKASQMPEWDFVTALVERADIGLMLDVNNIFVSSINHGFDPIEYLDNIPHDRVVQIHLAGHSVMEGYRLDTHDAPVCDEVWELYGHAIERIGPVSTLVEWDGQIPSWERLAEEADHARRVRDEALARREATRA
ncbi:MAG: DUF692 domain-containing protein [Myxococcales bacterium]|nr:DUF692 domain-containing protein [Myxococcales bacterium]